MNREAGWSPMFDGRLLRLAKDAEFPEENQDAVSTDASRGRAAIADGVASSLFAGAWARTLVEAATYDPPNLDDPEALARWLVLRREAWAAQVRLDRLAWHQKPKLREGAFSTLLWLQLAAGDHADAYRLQAWAIGDTCLFLVRAGQLVRSFPIQEVEQFETSPLAIGSIDRNHDRLLEFQRMQADCRTGDWLVLATDAMAAWVLRACQSGRPPHWDEFWEMGEDPWRERIGALRAERELRYDDTTLLMLRIGATTGRGFV